MRNRNDYTCEALISQLCFGRGNYSKTSENVSVSNYNFEGKREREKEKTGQYRFPTCLRCLQSVGVLNMNGPQSEAHPLRTSPRRNSSLSSLPFYRFLFYRITKSTSFSYNGITYLFHSFHKSNVNL